MNPLPDTFHNPYLWPLLLFALLPTVLYLVDRRRARRLDWPALRFFLTRQRARLRWIRLREALLILVRSLALFLVVYALLGPATRVERELSSSSSLSRGLVLVFDTSFSMSYSPAEEAGDLLKRAKARARTLLEELRPADSALRDKIEPDAYAAALQVINEKYTLMDKFIGNLQSDVASIADFEKSVRADMERGYDVGTSLDTLQF